jgi:hypothetical protein
MSLGAQRSNLVPVSLDPSGFAASPVGLLAMTHGRSNFFPATVNPFTGGADLAAVSCRQSRPRTIGGREGQMKAIFWTVSLIAGVLFGFGDVMSQLAAIFF